METVGLIAGGGAFPAHVARGARRTGRRVAAIALRELAEPTLAEDVDLLEWMWLGEFGRVIAWLGGAGVREVVLAGKVPKAFLWQRRDAVRPDAEALAMLAKLADRADDSLLSAVAALLEGAGFAVRSQDAWVPELRAPRGVLGGVAPSAAARRDVAFAWPIAKALGGLDVGQTVVVRDRAVLALEAVEGTDEAIRRGCALGAPGACVLKVAKPGQDPRFDVPVVGCDTLRAAADGGAALLAVEAGETLLLEPERLREEADARGLALLGVAEEDLAALGGAS